MRMATTPTRAEPQPSQSASTLRRLELLITGKLDGMLHGDHLGLVAGGGTEAGDGRLYQPGDDVRRIDWNLSARMNVTHVRDTIADRELETWLVVDNSASVDFGTARAEKRDRALAAASAFAFLTSRAGNRVGAVLFGHAGIEIVRPRAGRDAALALLHRVETRDRSDGMAPPLAEVLTRTAAIAHRRGLVVVVSDLLDEGNWQPALRRLTLGHDVVVAHLIDPRERQLPAVGLLTLVDPETGRRLEVQTASRRLRDRYAEAAAEQHDRIRQRVRRSGASLLELSTDRDWLLDIVHFVAARRRHR